MRRSGVAMAPPGGVAHACEHTAAACMDGACTAIAASSRTHHRLGARRASQGFARAVRPAAVALVLLVLLCDGGWLPSSRHAAPHSASPGGAGVAPSTGAARVLLVDAKDWSGTGGTGKGPKPEDIVDPATGLPVDFSSTDYPTPVRPDSLEYDRCKVTHRCNRALASYDVEEGRYNFTKQIFPGGVQDPADLFLDFENWESGTAGLFFDQTYLDRLDNSTVGGHFNSFELPLIGRLYLNHTCQLVLNTTGVNMQFYAADCSMFEFARLSAPGAPATPPYASAANPGGTNVTNSRGEQLCFQWDGQLVETPLLATQVAVFNFAHLYLGPVVDVVLTGVRALALVSRSTLVLDTMLVAPPGELGGFEGGHLVSPYGTNINGPGSGNKRVYLHTITTSATDVDEVQQVTTSAELGQTLGGTFRLSYKGDVTHPISHDATPQQLKQRIESSLSLAGSVRVSRSSPDDQGGFRWDITFVSAPGNVEQLEAHSSLTGRSANVRVDTHVEGNDIGGFFTVEFEGAETGLIPANASALELQDILEADLPAVATAHVSRNDPTGLCEAGLCSNGPLPAWGYRYTVTIATDAHNQAPMSPTSEEFVTPLPIFPATVHSYLTGVGANVSIVLSHDTTQPTGMPPHPLVDSSPFSLAYGGAGGSFGGVGGVGHARHAPAQPYLQASMPDLVGGSGGNVGGEISQQTLAAPDPPGRGGDGGGAIELVAVNDIVIGFHGGVDVSGQNGVAAYRGGGGGSGGSVVLAAGGVVNCHGLLRAEGGRGGDGVGTGSRGGGGGSGGRLAAYGQSLVWASSLDSTGMDLEDTVRLQGGEGGLDAAGSGANVNVVGGAGAASFSGVVRTAENTRGGLGSRHMVSAGGMRYRIDRAQGGAEDTQRTLRMDAAETVVTDSNVTRPLPYVQNGVSFSLPSALGSGRRGEWAVRRDQIGRDSEHVYESDAGTRPDRITFYVKLGVFPSGSVLANWGAQFAIHEYDFNHTYFNNTAEAAAGMTGPVGGLANDGVAMIGVSVVNGDWRHDSNYRHTPGAQLPPPKGVFSRNVQNERWYKVDIFIDWSTNTYKIRLDDITLVTGGKFNGESVRRLGLYVYNAATVWWDEIYAGAEDTMGFECPISREGEDPIIQRPWQNGWRADRLGEDSSFGEFVKHESHLSQRSTYTDLDQGGLVFFDGEPHIKFHSDIKFRSVDGDHAATRGGVWSGAMFYVPGDGASDLSIELAITIAAGGTGVGGGWSARRDGETRGDPGRFYWFGDHDTIWPDPPPWATGGVACCSTTDMVNWRNEGIMFHYNNMTDDVLGSDDSMHAERPKVMYNPSTNMYVMWMHADNEAIGIRSAGVALSQWANGPYGMLHTIRPDGNETTDLTVFHDQAVGKAYIARTYYATVNYWLPEPVMQPMWESVKNVNGTVDFSMNYHRAFYHSAYDNRDDIYQQRWRFEDKPWRIEAGDWVETLDQSTKTFILTNRVTGEVVRSTATERQAVLDEKLGVNLVREILGQGQPPVETRFKDPTDPINNQFRPASVPAVKAQTWGGNYLDKNIADNPPHRTVADKLIGVPHNVQSRRAKYIAVSELNDNFTDTTGIMRIVEGELEDDLDLISILTDYGRFGWDAGNLPRSTYPFDVTGQGEPFYFDTASDWFDRLHQFYIVENDRFDDFVNFRDKQSDRDRECPIKHQTCQDRAAQCQIIWSQQELKPEASILDSTFSWHSYSIAQPTVEYEECLRAVRQCQDEYRDCLHSRIPPRL